VWYRSSTGRYLQQIAVQSIRCYIARHHNRVGMLL
jgi:hypothetical protein